MRLPRYEHGIVTSRPFMILRQTDHVTNDKTYTRVHREVTLPIQFELLEDSPMRRIASDLQECFLYWDKPMILVRGKRSVKEMCPHIQNNYVSKLDWSEAAFIFLQRYDACDHRIELTK